MCNIQKALLPIITRVILALYILLLLSGTASNAQEAAKPVRIGVLAKRGAQRCLEKWGPTAEYLTREIPGYSFIIIPLDYDAIYSTIEQEEVDFILANPSFYVGLELHYGANRIATLNNFRLGRVSTVFGGVIFCKAEHKDLKHLNDLRGKKFMAVKETSFGGWQMVWRELKGHGVDPYRDFADLSFGGTHDAVIYAVLNGEVDAGAVRTDALERMANEGKINLADFYVFHEHECPYKYTPFLHSTHLYPEWPFASVKHTSDELAERVAVALLRMSPASPAAKAARCVGWTIPLNYQPVHDCLKYLRVFPYEEYGKLTLRNVIRQYLPWFLGAFVAIALIILFALYAARLNRRLLHALEGQKRELIERKRAEEKIRESAENYRELADSIGDVFFAMDGDLRYTYWNKASESLTGISANHAIGKTIFEIFPDNEDTRRVVSFYREVLKTQQSQNLINEYNLDGKAYFFEISAYPSKDGVSVFVKDITPQKKAEEAQKKSERRYHELFNSVMEGIAIVDENEIIKFCNPACAGIFEADSVKALEGKCILEYVPEHQKELILSQTEIRKRGLNSQYELDIVTARGNNRVGLISASPSYDDDGNFIGSFAAIIDITETKQLQESAERAKRLETAGKIAGQVAHDFNNLLAPLVAYPDFIKNELPEDHMIIPLLNDMEHAALHMADINQQLLTLGRRGHYSQVPLNLNEIILQVINQMKPLPNELVVETNLHENLMNIKAGPAQIHRVILNLLDNAKDAMRDIGQLTIKTENYYVDAMTGKYEKIPKGEYVKLTISDNGCGISDEIHVKIFDPFFTTKTTDKKRGSGLGLSVVDAVVKDHNGYVDFESAIGKGTLFYLYFPITRETVEESIPGEITGGAESILVIDDDKTQRDVTLRLLKNLGYESRAVESGEKAIELLKKSPHDLLLLDMIMPSGIDGAETYKRALAINSSQKAVIVSGYSETERVEEALKLGAGAYIRKPLTLKAIAAAIRKELDRVELQETC